MVTFKRFTGYILCALGVVLIASTVQAGYTRINQPNPADPLDAHIYKLENGLTVYLTENHETPRFHVEIAVRVGRKHDPTEATGVAHYLEHMLFKGTRHTGTLDYEKEKVHLDRITALYEQHFHETDPEERRAIYAEINKESQLAAQYAIPNEPDRLYKIMGAAGINAHTGYEETVYEVNLPANRLRQWAIIESERFQSPVFRLFQTELEAVYEEKNRRLDSKSDLIYDAVMAQLFKVHPYGQQPVGGKVEHLKNPSLRYMYDFYNTYYVPNNMAIIISGDINIQEVIDLIDENFSAWTSGTLPEPEQWQEEPLDGAERVTVQYPGEEWVMLAFRTVPSTHPDTEALMLVDMTLDNATAGLINLNLNQQQKVRQAGASTSLYWVQNDYGFQWLYGIPKQDQSLEEVEQLLLEQLELVKRGEFEDWIIPAIINDFKKTQKAGLESNSSRTAWMRNAFLAYEDWGRTVTSLDRMAKVTKADVVRVANEYFGADYVAGYRKDGPYEVPTIEKPQLDRIAIDPRRVSAFAQRVLSMPVEELQPVFVDPETDYQVTDYHDGVKVYYARNPLNDLFTFSITFDVGRRYQDKLGAAAMLLNRSGTSTLSAEALKKEWYKLGTTFNISTDDNQTSMSISGLDENFVASLALMMDYVKHPSADQTTLDQLIKIILFNRADVKKNYRAIHNALIQYNRYGKESSYLNMTLNEEMQKATVEELHSLIRDLFTYQHTIAYTGSASPEQVISALKTHHSITASLKNPPPYQFLKTRRPEATEIIFFHKEIAQAQVWMGFGDEVYDETKNPVIQLYNNYFSGDMSSIVFQELREARALAYDAYARYVTGSQKGDENWMYSHIFTQADKTSEAVAAFIELIDNLPASPERFTSAQGAILNRYRTSKLGFRDVLDAVRSWERLGLPIDPRKWRFEQIQNADIDLMLQFHRNQIQGRPKLISIVGDKNKIDMENLAEHGKIIEVKLEDLFVF